MWEVYESGAEEEVNRRELFDHQVQVSSRDFVRLGCVQNRSMRSRKHALGKNLYQQRFRDFERLVGEGRSKTNGKEVSVIETDKKIYTERQDPFS